jgi:hypothetical protein
MPVAGGCSNEQTANDKDAMTQAEDFAALCQADSPRNQPHTTPEFFTVTSPTGLLKLQQFLAERPSYNHFKAARDKKGRMTYFLGDETIKGRNRGRHSKFRQPFVKAHTIVCVQTDDLDERVFPVIDERCAQEINTNV